MGMYTTVIVDIKSKYSPKEATRLLEKLSNLPEEEADAIVGSDFKKKFNGDYYIFEGSPSGDTPLYYLTLDSDCVCEKHYGTDGLAMFCAMISEGEGQITCIHEDNSFWGYDIKDGQLFEIRFIRKQHYELAIEKSKDKINAFAFENAMSLFRVKIEYPSRTVYAHGYRTSRKNALQWIINMVSEEDLYIQFASGLYRIEDVWNEDHEGTDYSKPLMTINSTDDSFRIDERVFTIEEVFIEDELKK